MVTQNFTIYLLTYNTIKKGVKGLCPTPKINKPMWKSSKTFQRKFDE